MIIRRKVNSRFTVVPNEPITDERLSFECLGLLTYLLSRPDNWSINLSQLRDRGGIGREKMQQLMRQLIEFGYAVRRRERDSMSKQFGSWHYVIYDHPQAAEPGTEIPSVAPPSEATDGKAGDGKPVPILKTDYTKSPYGEADASRKGGVEATTSSQIWAEALNLLSQCPGSEIQKRTLIGKWQKRTPTELAKKELLAAVLAAQKAGTPDPVSYIEAALRKYPTPPDPATLTASDWKFKIQGVINTKTWNRALGPPPGKPGCRVPPDLITPQLQSALSQGMRA